MRERRARRRDFGAAIKSLQSRAHRVGSDVVDHMSGAFHNVQFAADFARELDRLVFESGDLVAVAGDEPDRTHQLTVELRDAQADSRRPALIRPTLFPLG